MNAETFREVWEKGDYRRGSTAQRLVPFLRRYIPDGSVINDYGSGTGRAEYIMMQYDYRINMVDIADNALEDEARSLIGDRLTYTVAPLWQLPEDFPVADWGICINVLMVADPSRLEAIQREMRRTSKNLIVEAYDFPDFRLGHDMTHIKLDAAGWAAEMKKYWPDVESVASPEHRRRYITICRGGVIAG